MLSTKIKNLEKRILKIPNRKMIFGLIALFLSFRIPLLLNYEGIIGSDESFYMLSYIDCLLSGKLECIPASIYPYNYFTFITQCILSFPFYLIFGDSEFTVFSGAIFISTITLLLMFIYLNKLYGKNTAILAVLSFIFCPLGFSLFSISGGGIPGRHIFYLGSMIILLFISNIKNNPFKIWVSILLLLFLSPIFILTAIGIIFIYRKTLFHFKFTLKSGLIIFSGISLASAILFSSIERAIKISLEYNFQEISNIFFKLTIYLSRIFIGGSPYSQIFSNIQHGNPNRFEEVLFLTIPSAIIFLIISIYVLLKKGAKKSFFIPVMGSLFLMISFEFIIKLYNIFGEIRPISSYPYLYLPLFFGCIGISIFCIQNKCFKYPFYFFLILNLIINIYASIPTHTHNNRVIYNLGSNYSELNIDIFSRNYTEENLKNHFNISVIGYWSREFEHKILNTIFSKENDLVFFGVGLKLFYGNIKGQNYCHIFHNKKKLEWCRKGYLMKTKKIMSLFNGEKWQRQVLLDRLLKLETLQKS